MGTTLEEHRRRIEQINIMNKEMKEHITFEMTMEQEKIETFKEQSQ